MTTVATPIKAEHKSVPAAENHKGIENHKKAAAHLQEAAKHHLDAAKHHEAGEHEKAAHSTIVAQGHHRIASEAQKEDVLQHATSN